MRLLNHIPIPTIQYQTITIGSLYTVNIAEKLSKERAQGQNVNRQKLLLSLVTQLVDKIHNPTRYERR